MIKTSTQLSCVQKYLVIRKLKIILSTEEYK